MKKIIFCSSLAIIWAASTLVKAESPPPISTCQPPSKGQYLILVINSTAAEQDNIRQVLTPQYQTKVCKYLKDVVLRIEGFKNIVEANQQAQNLSQKVKAKIAIATYPNKTPATRPNSTSYQPKPLSKGYAVLVGYASKPQIATRLHKFLKRKIGLVSYRQRPYLLASHLTDKTKARWIRKKLSDRGFATLLVDSTKVVLLKQSLNF
jgi:hypothetical protein